MILHFKTACGRTNDEITGGGDSLGWRMNMISFGALVVWFLSTHRREKRGVVGMAVRELRAK